MDRPPVDPRASICGCAHTRARGRARHGLEEGRAHVSKRKLSALAVPAIAVLAILVATQVFSIDGTTTSQQPSDTATGQAVSPEPAAGDADAEAGAQPGDR